MKNIGMDLLRTKSHVALITLAAALLSFGAHGFEVNVHVEMTKTQLRTLGALISGQNRHFSERALEQLAESNKTLDDVSTRGPTRAALFFPQGHFTNETYAPSMQRLIDLKRLVITSVTASPADGDRARQLLGEALHTLQDFYGHSTWVEAGRATINSNLGRNITSPAGLAVVCPASPSTVIPSVGVTSPYFIEPSSVWTDIRDRALGFKLGLNTDFGCAPVPAGKCHHGNYTNACLGVNKDLDAAGATENSVPESPYHAEAYRQGGEATRDYVQQIFTELAGNDRALSALLDTKGDIGFVVDTTGSMGNVIDQVKIAIQGMIIALNSAPAGLLNVKPDRWILSTFSDPSVGTPFITESAEVIQNAVAALRAGGGGDCPERSQEGLRRAVEAAIPNSRLFMFTDASAKDSSLANVVISRAQQKNVRLNYVLNGSCSPIDSAYIRGAAETGGQLFVTSTFEVSQVLDVVKATLTSGSIVRITKQSATLIPRQAKIQSFPVDSLGRLIVSVSVDGTKSSIRLIRPNGTIVVQGQTGVTVTDLSASSLFAIESPEPGIWTVETNGQGVVTLVSDGDSPIDFRQFRFVEPGLDIHSAFVPMDGQPTTGSSPLGEAVLLGNASNVIFEMRNETGEFIRQIVLNKNRARSVKERYIGSVELPSSNFQVVARGRDPSGFEFSRVYPVVLKAQPIGVTVDAGASSNVAAGKTSTLKFTIRNLSSESVIFNIQSTNSRGFSSSISSPSPVQIVGRGSLEVNVQVSVPASAEIEDLLSVTLAATRVTDASIFNSATALLRITKNVVGDVNADGIVDCTDIRIIKGSFGKRTGQSGFDIRADVNLNGSVDVRDLAFVAQNLPQGTSCN